MTEEQPFVSLQPTQQGETATPTPFVETSGQSVPPCSDPYLFFYVSRAEYAEGEAGIYAACLESRHLTLVIKDFEYGPTGIDISQEGNKLLFSPYTDPNPNYIAFVSLGDLNPQMLIADQAGKQAFYPQWSPNGNDIGYINTASERGDTIEILNVVDQAVSVIAEEKDISDFAWSPGGELVLYRGGEPLPNGVGLPLPTFIASLVCNNSVCGLEDKVALPNIGAEPSWSFDSALIVSVKDDGDRARSSIIFTDLQGSVVRETKIVQINPDLGAIYSPVQSPNGKHLAFVAEDINTGIQNLYVLNLETMALSNVTGNRQQGVYYALPAW